MKTNGLEAWFLASRPKTLTGAAAPVIVALASAFACTQILWAPALLCLLFAVVMQITANFVNDYFDFKKGVDNQNRLGPKRACAQGWITLPAMRKGIAVVTLLACCIGLPLIYWGGWTMILIGVLCVAACFLYTTTLSRIALGDLLVIVFFGLVPVCATYFLQTGGINAQIIIYGLSMGLVTDNLLIVNNYRDYEQDKSCGKKTLVVKIGKPATEWLYFIIGLLAVALSMATVDTMHNHWKHLLMIPYLILHLLNYHQLKTINHGEKLNSILGKTAFSIILFALSLSLAITL